jgi:hypothetical protein
MSDDELEMRAAFLKWERTRNVAPKMLELLREVRWGSPEWHDAKAALIKHIDGE